MNLYLGEYLAEEKKCNYVKGCESIGGKIFITNQRIVFESHGLNLQNDPVEIYFKDIVSVGSRNTMFISLILVPFGINKHTAFLSEKAIGAIFSISIKMMVLQFILCLAVPMMQNWGTMLTGKEDPATLLYVLLGCAAMAFLTWQAPGLAASLLSGSPSLTAGNAIGAASGVASMAAGGASRLAAGAGAVFQATRATNGAQGAAQFAKNLGAAALQSTSFSQGRQNMKSLIQNASQISSNNTDQDLFKSPR